MSTDKDFYMDLIKYHVLRGETLEAKIVIFLMRLHLARETSYA